jgi:methyl-accepting chemotaxis protein
MRLSTVSRGFALTYLTVARKLGPGFGLLFSLVKLLALTGYYGLHSNGQSLRRINRLGSLFDHTVFSCDADFIYVLMADSGRLARHDADLKTMQQMLSSVLDDIYASGWPQADLGSVKLLDEKLRVYVDSYYQARAGVDVKQAVLKLNELFSSLQSEIKELYAAEEVGI